MTKSFVTNWLKYNFGVFSESGVSGSYMYPKFYNNGSTVLPTSCTNEPIRWEVRIPLTTCLFNWKIKLWSEVNLRQLRKPMSYNCAVGSLIWSHYSRGSLCSSYQQAVWNTVYTFPGPVCLERVCCPSAWLTCSCYRARLWFLSAAPGVPKRSPIQALSRPNIA